MKSWLAVVVAVAGCGGAKAPVCNPDGPNSCAGVDAMCIPAYGVCASPDLSCPTSYRYDSSSGAMAGQCVASTIEIPSSLKWTAQPPPAGTDSDLQGIWGGSTNNLWAVGRAGGIVHGVNGAWSTVTSPVAGTALTGIWGSGANDVWAIGITGTIIHYDGTNWSRAQSPTASDLNAIWGADANHVWIAGADATLLQLAGAKWTLVDFSMPARGTFGALWGSRPDDVYVVGNDGVSGVIGHFDGAFDLRRAAVAERHLERRWERRQRRLQGDRAAELERDGQRAAPLGRRGVEPRSCRTGPGLHLGQRQRRRLGHRGLRHLPLRREDRLGAPRPLHQPDLRGDLRLRAARRLDRR